MTRRFLGAVSLLLAAGAGSMRAGDIAYMVAGAGEGVGPEFGTIDLSTGGFSSLGDLPLQLVGLGVADGTLYGAGLEGTLYTANTANGSLSVVGTSPIDYADFGSTLTGLYALDDSMSLYSINPSTGAASLIGPTGLVHDVLGFSTNASALYLWDSLPQEETGGLYTLNTTTGAATFIGGQYDLGIGAMLMEDGTLYAGQDQPSTRVDTINLAYQINGGFLVNSGSSVFGTAGNFGGLAPDPLPAPSDTPEPGTWGLIGLGITGMAPIRRRSS